MAQSIEESLLQAIKKDDIKAFDALTEKAQCGSYRLGRFPLLSLMYLYKSKRLVSSYEEKLLKITGFTPMREPAEISAKFSSKAGKCLRLYFDEIVTPAEMLLILNKIRRLKRIYPLTKQSSAVKERLKLIYSIRYSLTVKFEGDGIILDRRPLSYREKKNIATVCLCSVLAVTLAVGVPITAVSLLPANVAETPEPFNGEVTELSQINFSSKDEYTLKNDIVLPENYSVEKMNCTINGGGNKLVFGKGATVREFGGKLYDLIIESFGGAVFTTVSQNSTVENVTLNVSADISTKEATAFFAVTNLGTIDGVTVNVSGKINALSASEEAVTELTFGGIVQNNAYRYDASNKTYYRGRIRNCTVNFNNFELIGEASANAAFGGVAGVNSGYLQNCTVTGKIIADTFDVAGVCVVNYGMLSGDVNEADLFQTSSDTGWNPITCGIVLTNAYTVEKCENRGNISSVSDCGQFDDEGNEPTVSASGIAYISRGSATELYIKNCVNTGVIECSAEYRHAYASGICLSSSGEIEKCTNGGDVIMNTENEYAMYGGGITAISYGGIYYSVNDGAVSATGSGSAYIGGISAHTVSPVTNCISGGDITVTAKNVIAGGIFGFSEVMYNFYIYFGTADYCISESRINVTVTGEDPAYVGGIAGLIREAGFNSGGSVEYFGGCVTNSCFIGEIVSGVYYSGSIVGVCGPNIYENNSYLSGITEYHNFENNFYSDKTAGSFGATMVGDGEYLEVDGKGSTFAETEEIKNSEVYKYILEELEK